ncbi:MAG: restriction endonuclease [Candidatus Aminicenantes bacterium]|nr:restriction endonuclease [Candidatus Aminicenantes bacterium]
MNKKIKRINNWSPEKLKNLSYEDFIDTFVLAIEDRTNLKSGDLAIDNKIMKGAPPESINLCLKEAERRKIPLALVAERLVGRATAGKSFISNLMAPSNWRKFEIQAAKAIIKWVESDGIKLNRIDFDARIIGEITKSVRQVDLWLEAPNPRHTVAVECKDYESGLVSVEKVEAFHTKLKDIAANKGIYVTKNGYQRSAEATAEHYGIVLLTFDFVDKNKPPMDLNEKQRLELSLAQGNLWCLRHKESAWYFSET